MSSRHFYVANILSALVWAPIHVFPGVLVGLAIAFGGARAPELSVAAIGVLILAWIAWNMIKRKTAAGIMDCPPDMDFVHNSRWRISVARNRSRRASRTVSRNTTTDK